MYFDKLKFYYNFVSASPFLFFQIVNIDNNTSRKKHLNYREENVDTYVKFQLTFEARYLRYGDVKKKMYMNKPYYFIPFSIL